MLSVPPFQTLLRFYSHLTSRLLALPPPSFLFIFLSFSSLSRARARTHTHFSVSLYISDVFLPPYRAFRACVLDVDSFLFSQRDTTRPFNRVAFSLTRPIRPFLPPFRYSYFAVSSTFLLFSLLCPPPLSTALPTTSSSPGSLPSHPLSIPLGELYPVNRGTLLVTVCNLTEDQTKRDPTYHHPPLPLSPATSAILSVCAHVEGASVGKRARTWSRKKERERKR